MFVKSSMKKNILISFLFILPIFAQRPEHRPDIPQQFRLPFFVEVHVIPGDSLNTLYYSYRIPYNQLTFVKDGDKYKASLNVSIEVFDTSGQFISRQMKQRNIEVDNFSETNSPDYFCEDLLTFHLHNDDYNLIPIITDIQSGQEEKLDSTRVNKLKPNSMEILDPIVLNKDKIDINGQRYQVLTNYENSIPFSLEKYELAIPCRDTSIQKLYVRLINNRDTVFSGYTSESVLSDLSFKESENKIVLDRGKTDNIFRNFTIDNFSNLLSEGGLQIIISKDNKFGVNSVIFTKRVVWFNKPFSLRNPEFAISSLKYIESDTVISKLLDADKLDYMSKLQKYWEKYDPTPDTKFNEIMNVYYNRVDYAIRNFASLSNRNGADTDRGRIFIKYGKPAKIERNSNENGKVVELWIYSKENLSFKFVDKNGTGEFPLAKG